MVTCLARVTGSTDSAWAMAATTEGRLPGSFLIKGRQGLGRE